jgi:hypothetical protein
MLVFVERSDLDRLITALETVEVALGIGVRTIRTGLVEVGLQECARAHVSISRTLAEVRTHAESSGEG